MRWRISCRWPRQVRLYPGSRRHTAFRTAKTAAESDGTGYCGLRHHQLSQRRDTHLLVCPTAKRPLPFRFMYGSATGRRWRFEFPVSDQIEPHRNDTHISPPCERCPPPAGVRRIRHRNGGGCRRMGIGVYRTFHLTTRF